MTFYLTSQADLEAAIARLVRDDPRLKPALEQAGMPTLRRREPGFEGLAAIIVGQQLSTASARAIWGRLIAELGPLLPRKVLRAPADHLAALGLSQAKTTALKSLAQEIDTQRLDIDGLGDRDADEAHGILTALRGIGPWTADIYLLFCLGHGDAWPAGDLAIQEGVRMGLELENRPSVKEMVPLAEGWRPLRGATAHLWWELYRTIRRREGAPVASTTPAAPAPPVTPLTTSAASSKRVPRKGKSADP
jgi:DNA-3-methyladenine glycosylase II